MGVRATAKLEGRSIVTSIDREIANNTCRSAADNNLASQINSKVTQMVKPAIGANSGDTEEINVGAKTDGPFTATQHSVRPSGLTGVRRINRIVSKGATAHLYDKTCIKLQHTQEVHCAIEIQQEGVGSDNQAIQ